MFNEWAGKAGAFRRVQGIAAAALLAGSLVAAPAAAGTIGVSGGVLVVGAGAADGDVVLTGSTSGTDLVLLTAGAAFSVVTPGCVAIGSGTFTCALSGFTSLLAIGGSGHDALDFSTLTTISAILAGGGGDDTLLGSLAGGEIYGGEGLDTIVDIMGVNLIYSGPGDPETVVGVDLGEENPVFEPLPELPAAAPAPGSIALLLAGLAAAAVGRGADSRGGSRRNRRG